MWLYFFNLGELMYKITIDLSAWGTEDEIMTIETFDFDKIEIIKEFIEFQQEHGWAVDYDVVKQEEDEDEDEVEDGDHFYDAETDTWYQYDEENDEWNELEDESDEDEEDENENVEDNGGNTYIFNITPAAEDKEDAK
jgi:hypothetical protein